MITESLSAKLERLVPGAIVVLHILWDNGLDVREYQVLRAGRVLATGRTEREAIDRACFLWGAQR